MLGNAVEWICYLRLRDSLRRPKRLSSSSKKERPPKDSAREDFWKFESNFSVSIAENRIYVRGPSTCSSIERILR